MHTFAPYHYRKPSDPDAPPGYSASLDGIGYGLPKYREFEHNRGLLDPRTRVRRYRRAARSHPNAAGAIELVHAMLTAAEPVVQVGEGQSEEAADALRLYHGIGADADDEPLCRLSWPELVGHGCTEPVTVNGFNPIAIGYETDDGTGLHIPYLAPRRASNVWRYYEHGGELTAVELRSDDYSIDGDGGVYMPVFDDDGRRRLLWFAWRGGVNLGLGEGFDGLPIIRSVLADIEDSVFARECHKVAMHRHAVPTTHIKADWERQFATAWGSESQMKGPAEREAFIRAQVETYRKNFGYTDSAADAIAITGPDVEATTLGDGNLFQPAKYIDSIAALDRAVGERFMAGWIQQGRAGSGGARAMVDSQMDAMRIARDAYLAWFIRVLRRQLHGAFYDLNFPGMPSSERPTLTFSRDVTPAFLAHSEAALGFIDRGLPFPEDAQRKVAESFGWELGADDATTAADVRAVQAGGELRTEAGQRAAGVR